MEVLGKLESDPGRAWRGPRAFAGRGSEVGEDGGRGAVVQVLQTLHGADPLLSVHVGVELLVERTASGHGLVVLMHVRVALVLTLLGPFSAGETQLHAAERGQTFVP